MIDLHTLRSAPDQVRISQFRRGETPELVDQAVAADQTHRAALTAFERLRAEQKDLGRQVAKASADEQKKHQDFVNRMITKGYTEKQVRLLCEWYLRVRKSS